MSTHVGFSISTHAVRLTFSRVSIRLLYYFAPCNNTELVVSSLCKKLHVFVITLIHFMYALSESLRFNAASSMPSLFENAISTKISNCALSDILTEIYVKNGFILSIIRLLYVHALIYLQT